MPAGLKHSLSRLLAAAAAVGCCYSLTPACRARSCRLLQSPPAVWWPATCSGTAAHSCLPPPPKPALSILHAPAQHSTAQSFKPSNRSPMRPIFMPARASARRALWAPGPGVLVLLPPVARSLMCRAVMPSSCVCVCVCGMMGGCTARREGQGRSSPQSPESVARGAAQCLRVCQQLLCVPGPAEAHRHQLSAPPGLC
jgi:hypothetical protein